MQKKDMMRKIKNNKMVGYSNRNNGYDAEKFVWNFFRSNDFYVTYINDFYDILVEKNNKSAKIEVKSCNLMIKRDGADRLDYGRYDFTNKKSIKRQRSENVFLCFVVCIENSFEIIGFLNSRALKFRRYLPLKHVMQKKLTRQNKFIEKWN